MKERKNKKMEKLKNKKVGRPKYQPNIKQLKELYRKVEEKTITNEQGWRLAKCGKTKWYELKKLYYRGV